MTKSEKFYRKVVSETLVELWKAGLADYSAKLIPQLVENLAAEEKSKREVIYRNAEEISRLKEKIENLEREKFYLACLAHDQLGQFIINSRDWRRS